MKRANSDAIGEVGKGLCVQQHTSVSVMETVSRHETLFQERSKVRGKKHIVSIGT